MSQLRISTVVNYEPIDSLYLQHIRASGRDEAGNCLVAETDPGGGAPLRCCLRLSAPGEQVVPIAFTPPGTAGAHAERGPVFVHPGTCGGYPAPASYPPDFLARRQVVRGYDRSGRIADAVVVEDGHYAQAVIQEMLVRSGIAIVHVRNVAYGCYNFAARKCR